jgi:hypothetical protein
VITDLGRLGGPNSIAPEAESQPNARGEVAGASDTTTPDPNGEDFCSGGTFLLCLPFVWQKEVITALPTLGGTNGQSVGVNNRGQIVGALETPSDACSFAFLQVEAVLWEKGNIYELNTLIPPGSPLYLKEALSINDHGQIAGWGLLPDGENRGFLLTPCNESEEGCKGSAGGSFHSSGRNAESADDSKQFGGSTLDPIAVW